MKSVQETSIEFDYFGLSLCFSFNDRIILLALLSTQKKCSFDAFKDPFLPHQTQKVY